MYIYTVYIYIDIYPINITGDVIDIYPIYICYVIYIHTHISYDIPRDFHPPVISSLLPSCMATSKSLTSSDKTPAAAGATGHKSSLEREEKQQFTGLV